MTVWDSKAPHRFIPLFLYSIYRILARIFGKAYQLHDLATRVWPINEGVVPVLPLTHALLSVSTTHYTSTIQIFFLKENHTLPFTYPIVTYMYMLDKIINFTLVDITCSMSVIYTSEICNSLCTHVQYAP